MIPAIPLVGGLIGALASTPLGTTVARGILGGVVTGVVADVVMKRQQRPPQIAEASPGPITGGVVTLPDGQPLNPPATPGELSQQQMVDEYIRQRQGKLQQQGPVIASTNCPEGMVHNGGIPGKCVPEGSVEVFDPVAFINTTLA